MDKQRIKELIEIMDEAQLASIRVKDGDQEIELHSSSQQFPANIVPMMAERVGNLLADREASNIGIGAPTLNAASGDDDESVLVRSPMVGIFYVAPSPDEDPFVSVGQEVLNGQTLCIVEAMKMMNEIASPVSGTIAEVFTANGNQVEYDQPLFRIVPSAN